MNFILRNKIILFNCVQPNSNNKFPEQPIINLTKTHVKIINVSTS